jgi:drug/metabolite transporter (DMT)-like permease
MNTTSKPSSTAQIGASLGILAATAIWGSSFAVMKMALDEISPLHLLLFRFIIGTLAMTLLFGKQLKHLRLWMLKPALFLGGTVFLGLLLQTQGLLLTTASNSALIAGSYVVFVPLISWLLKQHQLQKNQLIFAVLALLGIGILSINEQLRFNSGDFLVLIAAICFSVQILGIDHYLKRLNATQLNFLQLGGCAVLCLIFAPIFAPWPDYASFSAITWFALIYSALVVTALAYGLQVVMQKKIKPQRASILFTAESLFGAFFGWLLLGEVFLARQWLGAIILFGSILGVVLNPIYQQRRQKNNLPL